MRIYLVSCLLGGLTLLLYLLLLHNVSFCFWKFSLHWGGLYLTLIWPLLLSFDQFFNAIYFFHSFTFDLPISLYLKWASCRVYIVGSFFLTHFSNLRLLIGVIGHLLLCDYWYITACLLFLFFCLLFLFLFLIFLSCFPVVNLTFFRIIFCFIHSNFEWISSHSFLLVYWFSRYCILYN